MAGVKSLIGLALAGSAGMTLLILACTIHQENWWPAILIIFYAISPIPILVSNHVSSDSGFGSVSNPPKEWAFFLTTGIVLSALILPIEMATVGTILRSAAAFSVASSLLSFCTIMAFFFVFQSEDNYSSGIY